MNYICVLYFETTAAQVDVGLFIPARQVAQFNQVAKSTQITYQASSTMKAVDIWPKTDSVLA